MQQSKHLRPPSPNPRTSIQVEFLKCVPPVKTRNDIPSTAGTKTKTINSNQCLMFKFPGTDSEPAIKVTPAANNFLGSSKNINASDVKEFLNKNKIFIENYILDHCSIKQLEICLTKKHRQNIIDVSPSEYHLMRRSIRNNRYCKNHKFKKQPKTSSGIPNYDTEIRELITTITKTLKVDEYRVFKMASNAQLPQCVANSYRKRVSLEHMKPMPLDIYTLQQIFRLRKIIKSSATVRISRYDNPERFPKKPNLLSSIFRKKNAKPANYLMYQPIKSKNENISYLLEMWRNKKEFKLIDQETSSKLAMYGSLAFHYKSLYLQKTKERNMSDFLLNVVKATFENIVSLDQLIKKILEFAQHLVNADRASLFLVDNQNSELVSTVFDLKYEKDNAGDMEKNEIRMPINRGIAGHVAFSGETSNIPDAYADPRFNRAIDEATGYKTASILCIPIKEKGKVIGVVQMVNKRNKSCFDKDDEANFQMFAAYFGLALHTARLSDTNKRNEQKYIIALEVLSYHNTCREAEVDFILNNTDRINVVLDEFYLDPYALNNVEKCKAVIIMFDDLFDMSRFDLKTLVRFILTVKKNYRDVPYHNYAHGWSVANAMYTLLKNDIEQRFDYKTRLALFVACLCHDLDHRGYTNQYMSETASPLAAMYSTSTLEHHHFNITVGILQQSGHNIFHNMSSDEYKSILAIIKHCILATDLAAFFRYREKIRSLNYDFNWSLDSHRELAMAMSMTAADLSASAKPWHVQIKTVRVIFEEFYGQGDKERAAGRTPMPMMDRYKPEKKPSSQVEFLQTICVPCYEILSRMLPGAKPMYKMALKNLEKWKRKEKEYYDGGTKSREDKEDENISKRSYVKKNDIIGEMSDLLTVIGSIEHADQNDNKRRIKEKQETTGVKIVNEPQGINSINNLWDDTEIEEGAKSLLPGTKTNKKGTVKTKKRFVKSKKKYLRQETEGSRQRYESSSSEDDPRKCCTRREH